VDSEEYERGICRMSAPPAARPETSRAGGRGVEVCTAAGQFFRRLPLARAQELVDSGFGVIDGERVRLRSGMDLDRISVRDEHKHSGERPDLTLIDRERYESNWRGSNDPHVGRGALGRRTVNRSIVFRAE
jgi:hypothetical protein